MAVKEYDVWLDKFNREIGFKSSVILFGNTTDIIFNKYRNGVYTSFLECVIDSVRAKGYKRVIHWDRVSGIDKSYDSVALMETDNNDGHVYDLDNNSEMDDVSGSYKDLKEFLPYMMNVIKQERGETAFILDYSDSIFGNANSLSEQEREYLTTIGKSVQSSQTYDMGSDFFGLGSLVIFITKDNATIPPAFYIGNPMVTSLNAPLPGRNERNRFVEANISCLNVTHSLVSDTARRDDFIDAMEGLSLKEIAQIMKMSRQITDEQLTYDKLINLFKYGEKISPWEELSKDKLEHIEERLSIRVKGQDEAIAKVKDVIIRAYTGFAGLQHSAKQKKPKGTLFFVGPTGVGKTELAKSLAEFVFGDENACIRFDMSEFNHEHSDQRLVGAPPGYVGYEAGGQLTNAVKERPFCVLLFDEIEKAHAKILDKFLQILEDGRLTDGKGETVYFSESIIIFTSNIGAAEVSSELSKEESKKNFLEAVRSHFIEELKRPEILNRIGDNIVAFNFISAPAVFTKIASVKFKAVSDFVKERYKARLVFENEEQAFRYMAQSTRKSDGGRGLLNIMETKIINPLSEFIFNYIESLAGRTIKISLMANQKNPQLSFFDFDLE